MPTVQQIWDRAVDAADMGDSNFPDVDRMLDYVNSAVSDLHYMLADATPDAEWHSQTATIPVTADDGIYALPNGTLYSSAPKFYKLLGLWRVENDVRFPVPKYHRSEMGGYRTSPTRAATLEMEYVPAYVNETTSTAEIDDIYPPGWDDIAVMGVAARLLHKAESFDAEKSIMALRGEKMGQLMRGCSPRDIGRPDRVEDVSGRWRDSRLAAQAGTAWFYYRIAGSNLYLVEPAMNASYYTY